MAVSPAAARAGEVTLSGDGSADGTLRSQIANAVAGDTITFAPGVNPVLTLGQITIGTEITLLGNGSGETTITAPSSDRVFRIQAGSAQTVRIQDLKITGGRAPGGSSPGAIGGDGGAILQETSHLFIDGVVFDNNSAGAGAGGSTGSSGGMGTGGTGGAGGAGGQGGAIYAFGAELDVRDSTFRNNFAGNGGIGGTGGSGAQGGTGGPGGHGGAGGAIALHSRAEITNTTFEDNSGGTSGTGGPGGSGSIVGGNGGAGFVGGQGGAIWQDGLNPVSPFVQVVSSTFNHNFAGDGGMGGNGLGGGSGGRGGSGGALDLAKGTIVNSTLTANQAGNGGAGGVGPFTPDGGQGGLGGEGGAIQGNANLISSTIAANRAGLGGAVDGGNGTGGGVFTGGVSTWTGTIIALNREGGLTTGPTANCNAIPQTSSFDLTFPGGTGCPGAVGNPLLGQLADNGGPTRTMALGAGSPAIDRVPVGSCSSTDQRGIRRPQGPACDIGAFERAVSPPPSPTPGVPNPSSGVPSGPAQLCAGHQATVAGATATISGTNGADVIRGTPGRDVIAGRGGKDIIRGLGGNDLLCGGAGKDTLIGGAGKDKLLGQGGVDALKGGKGKDKCVGGKGRDTGKACEKGKI